MKQFLLSFLLISSSLLSRDISVLIDNIYLKTYTTGSAVLLADSKGIIARLKKGVKFTVSPGSPEITITIQNKTFKDSVFYLSADNEENIPDPAFILSDKSFKNKIKLTLYKGKIYILNIMPVDEYLKGVIPYEMPVRDFNDYEALKAFCVVARSYTYMKMRETKGPFDVTVTVQDQVFKGEKEPNPLYNMAINATAGQLILFNDKPAVVFYHACCGGHTENSDNVFNKLNIPYLQGVEDSYCTIAPGFEWVQTFTEKQIQIRAKADNSELVSVSPGSLNASGRIQSITLKFTEQEDLTIPGKNIRSFFTDAVTGSLLKSTRILSAEVNKKNEEQKTLVIKGRGNGHGVGLCQWGAIGQSRKNRTYKEIIEHYFPGTEVEIVDNP